MVYAQEVEGRELTFGVSGKLIMNALVMFDRQTDSLWSQFLGQAVQGELKGAKLELVPSQLLNWGAWKAQHPETVVVDQGGRTYDGYMSYYFSRRAGIYPPNNLDDRLHSKALVIGVVGESGQKAYPFGAFLESPVANDTLEGRDLVVVLDTRSGASNVFDRTVNGSMLTFDQGELPLLFVDRETGSTWNKETGIATEGQLMGKRLQLVPSFVSFWFAWTDYYPSTELYTDSGG